MTRRYTLTAADVGRATIRAFGRAWWVCDFIGRVLPGDVGKRVYLVGGILSVENDEQRDAAGALVSATVGPPESALTTDEPEDDPLLDVVIALIDGGMSVAGAILAALELEEARPSDFR